MIIVAWDPVIPECGFEAGTEELALYYSTVVCSEMLSMLVYQSSELVYTY